MKLRLLRRFQVIDEIKVEIKVDLTKQRLSGLSTVAMIFKRVLN